MPILGSSNSTPPYANEERLNDQYVITHSMCLKTRSNYPHFITSASRTKLKTFLSNIDTRTGNISNEQIDRLPTLWKELLSDAITFLKMKDKREWDQRGNEPARDLVAFGVEELHKYFEEYRSFEAILYGADGFYRDHVMHVFRVWLLGMWLIEEEFRSSINIDYKLKDSSISNDEIIAMWCIIALGHDLGYPLDKVEKVHEKINTMMRYFGQTGNSERPFQTPVQHHFINDFILKFIGSKLIKRRKNRGEMIRRFGTALQAKYYLKFSKSLEKFDHGIISCILLMKNLVYFLESDLDLGSPFDQEDARQFSIRREILRAIAGHTCTDIYHLYPNSLPFILILADELQIWERPTFKEIKGGSHGWAINVFVPNVSMQDIKIKLELEETKELGAGLKAGEDFFRSVAKKWHKWLRSALDVSKRNFSFSFETKIVPIKGKDVTYIFRNEPGQGAKVLKGDEELELATFLH